MINNNVSNWLAETKEGNLITIDKAVNGVDYYCADCKQILHSRALNSELVTPHFYHLNNNLITSCSCEGAYKRYWREYLINIGEIINLKFLNNITCTHKEINYKINEFITADIYIKTKEGQTILFVFDKIEANLVNIKHDIFYIDIMNLELNKSNFNYCNYLLHSADIERINSKLKIQVELYNDILTNNTTKHIKGLNTNINIEKFKELQNTLYESNCIKEYELIDNVIKSLKERQGVLYKYKSYNITIEELNALNKLLNAIKKVVNLNIDLDINILKRIQYKAYNKGYYNNNWSKCLYFDIVKPLMTSFSEYIKEATNIIDR